MEFLYTPICYYSIGGHVFVLFWDKRLHRYKALINTIVIVAVNINTTFNILHFYTVCFIFPRMIQIFHFCKGCVLLWKKITSKTLSKFRAGCIFFWNSLCKLLQCTNLRSSMANIDLPLSKNNGRRYDSIDLGILAESYISVMLLSPMKYVPCCLYYSQLLQGDDGCIRSLDGLKSVIFLKY